MRRKEGTGRLGVSRAAAGVTLLGAKSAVIATAFSRSTTPEARWADTRNARVFATAKR